MARPWRDIMSYQDFQRIANTKTGIGKHFVLGKTARSLQDVADKIRLYHQLSKTSAYKIGARRQLLGDIADAAEAWFTASGTSKEAAAKRPDDNKLVNETTLPLERIMLTLTRRSLRKRDYLQQLATYLAGAMSPAQLIQYVRSPQERGGGQIGLTVKMEKEDFAHRDGFEDAEMAQAFEQWCDDTRVNNIPFFLWLEAHPICTSPDKSDVMVYGPATVEYVGNNRPSANSKMRVLDLTTAPPIREIDLAGGGTVPQLCDTYAAGYRGGRQKAINPSNQWGRGIACFVWAPNDDIFIAEHCPGKFHHSSFLSGGNVKCAGMIGIQQGTVKEISNNSGHYKPKPEEFRVFVAFLQQKGVTADDCFLKVTGGGNADFIGPIKQYARHGRGGMGSNWRR